MARGFHLMQHIVFTAQLLCLFSTSLARIRNDGEIIGRYDQGIISAI